MGNHESGCATANSAMAKYFLHVKVFSRGKGSRVTRAAAYRAGERIRDERTSEVYNYERLPDLEGFLKFASIPDWRRVRLTPVTYPTVARSRPGSVAGGPPASAGADH